jgi:uncharacterized protein YegP (UPF0339 family)
MSKFSIEEAKNGVKFSLKADNGETIATSEVYETLAACHKGVDSVRKCALAGKIVDLTENETATNPKFEIYQDKRGRFRFRLRARNGQIIAVSEGYATKLSCLHGIESVRLSVPDAEIE